MKGKYFIDTNIIIYTFDKNEKRKKKISDDIIMHSLQKNNGIISYQVIQEFLNVSLSKFKNPLNTVDCKFYIEAILEPICEIYPTIELYYLAIDVMNEIQISFYDSLIVAAAIKGRCNALYSEDLNHKQEIRGVTIINPYKE